MKPLFDRLFAIQTAAATLLFLGLAQAPAQDTQPSVSDAPVLHANSIVGTPTMPMSAEPTMAMPVGNCCGCGQSSAGNMCWQPPMAMPACCAGPTCAPASCCPPCRVMNSCNEPAQMSVAVTRQCTGCGFPCAAPCAMTASAIATCGAGCADGMIAQVAYQEPMSVISPAPAQSANPTISSSAFGTPTLDNSNFGNPTFGSQPITNSAPYNMISAGPGCGNTYTPSYTAPANSYTPSTSYAPPTTFAPSFNSASGTPTSFAGSTSAVPGSIVSEGQFGSYSNYGCNSCCDPCATGRSGGWTRRSGFFGRRFR